ncbi:unnamed protein product [Adineta steineri]|uniref:Endonuclease/exonuclease/phosphatase domain-containing protein n=1 Tax=Adineta steineri TaxID=433720 RepID=A0A819CLR0_9BILA|nr:unnamed protein product [Adineta steineri]
MTNTSETHRTNSNNHIEALVLSKEFMSITNTGDIDAAMMILKQNEWKIEQAISAYFDLKQMNSHKSNDGQNQTFPLDKRTVSTNNGLSNVKTQFKLLSWNIDGLDEDALEIRTRSIVDIIKKEEPDAVFLQEVIPTSLQIIRKFLPEYKSYIGNNQGYFVVILIRQDLFIVHGFELIPYPGTMMNRNLLIVHTTYKNSIEIDFMTSHHESGTEAYASNQRMEQLKLCFKRMMDAPDHRIVLFGGDLNMRERELREIGNIPSGICDLWIETGKQKECTYTWDMSINTNNYFPNENNRPRARFDRLYFRKSLKNDIKFQPICFEVKGLEIIPSIQRYCSDHWAIQAYFNI